MSLVLKPDTVRPLLAQIAAGLCISAFTSPGFAVGFRLPNQDPEGIARGNAFVASVDNPSAIYHNPAGITRLSGQNFSLGAYLISTNIDFRNGTGGTAETDEAIQAVPQIHYVNSPEGSSWSWGVGLYAPYGLGIDYGRDTPFSTVAEKGKMVYLTLNPVLAFEASPTLSVAAGLTLNYSEVDLRQAIGLVPGDEFRVKGDGRDYGYNLGLTWEISQDWTFGLSYRSQTEIEYDGESRATSSPFFTGYVPTTAELPFPQHIDLGLAYHPGQWTYEFNLDWTDWSRVESTTFEGTALGDLPFQLNYVDSLMYEFGATRQLDNNLRLSFGYIFSENSAPDMNFSPFNPDSNLHLGSLGLSGRTASFGWALGYHFAYNGGRRVSGNQSGSLLGETADGHYETFNQALNFSLTFSF